jgi:hypothetical protein
MLYCTLRDLNSMTLLHYITALNWNKEGLKPVLRLNVLLPSLPAGITITIVIFT